MRRLGILLVAVLALSGCNVRYGWGADTLVGGPVGDGTPDQRESPTRIGTASDWTAVDVASRTCGLRSTGALWCWGYCVGDGTATSRVTPVRIGTESDWAQVSAGGDYTEGLRAEG